MITTAPSNHPRKSVQSSRSGITTHLPEALPLPLFLLQPILARIVSTIAKKHPGIFVRLGTSAKKKFVINPENLPLVFLLQPDPDNPKLTAHGQACDVEHDVYIAGSFLTLLRMIDAQTDSDALFFSRDIKVTGNSEAMVALRNALDDMDETLADDMVAAFGPLKKPMRTALNIINKFAETNT